MSAQRGWMGWATPPRRRVIRRSFKVALAAALATFVAQALRLPVPWFATISAVVAVEVTLRASLRSGRNAVFGALVGALVGLALASVAKDQSWAVGLVVMLCLVVFGLVRLESVGRQAALVASVIVLVPASTGLTTPEFAMVRLVETLIGIAIALAVNAVILPPRAFRGARRHLGESYVALARMYRSVVASEATGRPDPDAVLAARRAFRASIREVDELWSEALSEHPEPDELAPHWHATTRRIWEQCASMADVTMDEVARGALESVQDELSALADATAAALDEVAAVLTSSDEEPVPAFADLEARRTEMLGAVRDLQVHQRDLSFTRALQLFTFVNAMSMIAVRVAELAVPAPDAVNR